MKKIISFVLSGVMLLSLTACAATPSSSNINKATASPEITASPAPFPAPVFPTYPEESADISDLSEYTIVYPSYYDEYRMGEVFLLKNAIKNVTGAELDIISDGEAVREHEIIFASSGRKNGVEKSIEMFQSGLDYVVGTLNGNIILGGNNFYADMRAVYDFINNYLGYNDIDNIYSEPQKSIDGINFRIYQKPLFTFYANNGAVSMFTEQYAVRDLHEAHFNLVDADLNWATYEQFRDFIKWCARYDIFIVVGSQKWFELYYDCPVIWGHFLRDEPPISTYADISRQCDEYTEKYKQYNWKPWVNFFGFDKHWNILTETDGLFDSVPRVSFDRYFANKILQENDELLTVYESARDYAQNKNQELWTYIQSYNCLNENIHTDKTFRWSSYISMCFGATGILYFQYGDSSPNYSAEGDWSGGALINWDYSKNPAWYHAKAANEELLKIAEVYLRYQNIGAYVINRKELHISAYLNDPYPYTDDFIKEFVLPDGTSDTYLTGLFNKKNGDGKALIIVNLEDIDERPYEQSEERIVKIKLNGENAVFYRDGEPQNIQTDANGYYLLNISNGYCWFITFE